MDTERLAALKGDLDLWYDTVARFEYSKSSEYDEHFDHKDFFEIIAAFVEFILRTEELRDVLQEIRRAEEPRLNKVSIPVREQFNCCSLSINMSLLLSPGRTMPAQSSGIWPTHMASPESG